MKIATFNINNVNKRLANLLGWLRRARPDVVCLQELKAQISNFQSRKFRKPVTAPSAAGRSYGMELRYLRAIASPSSPAPSCQVISPIRKVATLRQPSTAC